MTNPARSKGSKFSFRSLLATAAAILIAGCAYSIMQGSTVDQTKVDKIETGIQQIRQLNFLQQVPLIVADRDEAEQMMEADLMRDYTDNQLRADGAAGALLGLFPAGIDYKAESLKLMRSQVAGFYDARNKRMVMVTGATDLGFMFATAEFVAQRDIAGEMVLAHELTHALQDQHFDLDKKLEQVKNSDDRALALKSVAEGDATIAGYAYVAGRMDDAVLDTLLAHLSDITREFAAQSPDTPEGIATPLIFQYSEGVKFVADAYRRGGWKGVDALYSNPPMSAHQIIHPASYFKYPALPIPVSVHGYEPFLTSWNKVDDDTFGELLLRIILQRNLAKDSPDVGLAQEWAGDQMVVLQSGRQVAVIWIVAFANVPSANKFAAVYASLLDKLLGNTRHEVDYQRNAVLVVIGDPAGQMETLAPAIWAHSKVGD